MQQQKNSNLDSSLLRELKASAEGFSSLRKSSTISVLSEAINSLKKIIYKSYPWEKNIRNNKPIVGQACTVI